MSAVEERSYADVQADALEAAARARDTERIGRIFRHMQAEGVSAGARLTVLRTVVARWPADLDAGQ